MRFVGLLLIFGGYSLVYASVANHGRFATEPWAGLFADAYATGESVTVSAPVTRQQAAAGTSSVGAVTQSVQDIASTVSAFGG